MSGLSRNRRPKDQQAIAGLDRQKISAALPEIAKVSAAWGSDAPAVDRDRGFEPDGQHLG